MTVSVVVVFWDIVAILIVFVVVAYFIILANNQQLVTSCCNWSLVTCYVRSPHIVRQAQCLCQMIENSNNSCPQSQIVDLLFSLHS